MSDGKFYVRAAWSANLVTDFSRCLAVHRYPIDCFNAIAKTQTGPICRRIFKCGRNVSVNRIADGVILNRRADSVVLALLLSLHLLELLRIKVIRMRIERPQHAGD